MSDNTLISAEIIAAFVSHNSVPASELPALIRAVVGAFDNLGKAPVVEKPAPKLEPAVPIKKSIHHEFLYSLEDGKKYLTLKRHLSSRGMTPEQYREKWSLPADYPMTSNAYAEKRSAMSIALGLGRKKPIKPVEDSAKVRNPRPKPTGAAEAPAKPPESVQEPAETPQAANARSNTKAPLEVEAPVTARESLGEPIEAQQEAE